MSSDPIRCWAISRQPKRLSNYVINDGSTRNNVVLKQGAGHVLLILGFSTDFFGVI